MSLFNIEYKNSKKPYHLGSQILNNKTLMETSKNISNKSGTINDLNFAYQQQLLNESNNCAENKNSINLLKDQKTINSLLNVLDVPGNIKGNIDSLYSLAENSNLDKTLDELLNSMNKATKAVKSIFKGLF